MFNVLTVISNLFMVALCDYFSSFVVFRALFVFRDIYLSCILIYVLIWTSNKSKTKFKFIHFSLSSYLEQDWLVACL